MNIKMTQASDQSWSRLVILSAWGLDLWVSLVVTMVVAIVVTTEDFEPKNEWIIPLIGWSSVTFLVALNLLLFLRSRLSGSDYGDLVRTVDGAEDEARLPFSIMLVVTGFSAVCTTVSAIAIEGIDTKWAESTMLICVCLFVSWSSLGLMSLLRIIHLHLKKMAIVERLRKEAEDAQFVYDQEQRGVEMPVSSEVAQ